MTAPAGSSTPPPLTDAAQDSAQSDESATNTECACDSSGCDAICAAADRLPLPSGEELAQLILDALPPS